MIERTLSHGEYYLWNALTLSLLLTTLIPYANSLDPDETRRLIRIQAV